MPFGKLLLRRSILALAHPVAFEIPRSSASPTGQVVLIEANVIAAPVGDDVSQDEGERIGLYELEGTSPRMALNQPGLPPEFGGAGLPSAPLSSGGFI